MRMPAESRWVGQVSCRQGSVAEEVTRGVSLSPGAISLAPEPDQTARPPAGNDTKRHPRGPVICHASDVGSLEHVSSMPPSNTNRRAPDLNATADRIAFPNSGRAAATSCVSGVRSKRGIVPSATRARRAGASRMTSQSESRVSVSMKSMLILVTRRPRRRGLRIHRSSCSTGSVSVLTTTPWSTSRSRAIVCGRVCALLLLQSTNWWARGWCGESWRSGPWGERSGSVRWLRIVLAPRLPAIVR